MGFWFMLMRCAAVRYAALLRHGRRKRNGELLHRPPTNFFSSFPLVSLDLPTGNNSKPALFRFPRTLEGTGGQSL